MQIQERRLPRFSALQFNRHRRFREEPMGATPAGITLENVIVEVGNVSFHSNHPLTGRAARAVSPVCRHLVPRWLWVDRVGSAMSACRHLYPNQPTSRHMMDSSGRSYGTAQKVGLSLRCSVRPPEIALIMPHRRVDPTASQTEILIGAA